MEKIIEIDLLEKSDLLERYNNEKINKNLINYIIESAKYFGKNDIVKIVINNGMKEQEDCAILIRKGLKNEHSESFKKHIHTNLVQLVYLIIGMLIIFISTLMKVEVFREIVLIGGWVLIWSVVELEIFSDVEGRRRRKILKKLLNSDVVENKNK